MHISYETLENTNLEKIEKYIGYIKEFNERR